MKQTPNVIKKVKLLDVKKNKLTKTEMKYAFLKCIIKRKTSTS